MEGVAARGGCKFGVGAGGQGGWSVGVTMRIGKILPEGL